MTQLAAVVSGDLFFSKLGWIAVAWTSQGICGVTFGQPHARAAEDWWRSRMGEPFQATGRPSKIRQRLQRYASGASIDFRDELVDWADRTEFQRRVLGACQQIPYGDTLTYGELAQRVGSPGAARAVGQVMARNPVPLIVPCHRVVGEAGRLGGFSAPSGLAMKCQLLEMEGCLFEGSTVAASPSSSRPRG